MGCAGSTHQELVVGRTSDFLLFPPVNIIEPAAVRNVRSDEIPNLRWCQKQKRQGACGMSLFQKNAYFLFLSFI